MVDAKILCYRRGRHTQNTNQMIVKIQNVEDKAKAESYVGKKVIYKNIRGKEVKGNVLATHGTKGLVRAKFETNLPGQSFNRPCQIE